MLQARLTDGKSDIIMALKSGKAIRFNESKIRVQGRNTSGVRGIRLANAKDEVIGMVCTNDPNQSILVVSENGYGKRSDLEDYRVQNRGGMGSRTMNVTDKTGKLIAIKNVVETDDLMIINKSGIIIRMAVSELRLIGKATQGVRLIKLKEDDEIASVADVAKEEIDEAGNPEIQNTEGISNDIDNFLNDSSNETPTENPTPEIE